jgi:TRAP-type uncharacterized transport system substrate-binding protein
MSRNVTIFFAGAMLLSVVYSNWTFLEERWNKFRKINLVIATGSEKGFYHAMAESIEEILEESGKYEVRLEHSHGSIENLEWVSSHKADLAIIQGDIVLEANDQGDNAPKTDYKALNWFLYFLNAYILLLEKIIRSQIF